MDKNSFNDKVYALVALIPPGKVMTYGQIRRLLRTPYSPLMVGYAMSAAPPTRNLPCHRVVNRLGQMAPGLIFGGEDRQRALLLAEGVPFLPDGRIDLAKALYRPDDLDGEE